MLRRTLLCLALFATAEAAKAKADPKECEVCIANLEAIDKLIDKDEKTSKQSIMEAITKHLPRVLCYAVDDAIDATSFLRRRRLDGAEVAASMAYRRDAAREREGRLINYCSVSQALWGPPKRAAQPGAQRARPQDVLLLRADPRRDRAAVQHAHAQR